MSVKSARPHPPRHSHRHGHTDRDGRQCMPTNDHFETSDDGCFANRESPRPSTSTNIFDKYLEDHPRTCKWVITMVSCRKSPKRGFWDPFQMAVSWLINGVDPNYFLCKWDDPPSTPCTKNKALRQGYEAHDSLNKTA